MSTTLVNQIFFFYNWQLCINTWIEEGETVAFSVYFIGLEIKYLNVRVINSLRYDPV